MTRIGGVWRAVVAAACLLCTLTVAATVPVGAAHAAAGDAPASGIRPDPAPALTRAEPRAPAAPTPGDGRDRGLWPEPRPDGPETRPPREDRAVVFRGPPFVRGAARSGDGLIAASRGRTCAVRTDGRVTCWGRNGGRERLSASALRGIVSVSTGDHPHQELHVCALHHTGSVWCWGAGREGQLGRGGTASGYLPAPVAGIADAVALAAGSDHTCVVHAGGQVSCWGDGSLGQLGDGMSTPRGAPQRVPGLEGVARIDAGPSSTCAIHVDGALSCWGYAGGAGDAGFLAPARVAGLPPVASVATGWDRTCAVAVTGEVYCWPVAAEARPAPVAGIGDAVTVAVGDGGACAVHDDGAVSCWGENNAAGQLGDGTTTPVPRPTRVAGIGDAVAVTMSAGSTRIAAHTCAAHESGSYSCWGGNEQGQLGNDTVPAGPTPVPVTGPADVPAERVPQDATDLLRTWIDGAVARRESAFPWLRAAWDHIRDRAAAASAENLPGADLRGVVRSSCNLVAGLYDCWATGMEVAELNLDDVVHELAHVYDETTRLAGGRAWGAVQLYFAARYPDCFRDYGQRAGAEIIADTMTHLAEPAAFLVYYEAGCPDLAGEPDREAEQVVRSGLAGEVPAWYVENITSGAELWTAMRRILSPTLLANLANEFGGFCSTGWFRYPLNLSLLPPARTNPFRDGGC